MLAKQSCPPLELSQESLSNRIRHFGVAVSCMGVATNCLEYPPPAPPLQCCPASWPSFEGRGRRDLHATEEKPSSCCRCLYTVRLQVHNHLHFNVASMLTPFARNPTDCHESSPPAPPFQCYIAVAMWPQRLRQPRRAPKIQGGPTLKWGEGG